MLCAEGPRISKMEQVVSVALCMLVLPRSGAMHHGYQSASWGSTKDKLLNREIIREQYGTELIRQPGPKGSRVLVGYQLPVH
jgi:hypothetical protein